MKHSRKIIVHISHQPADGFIARPDGTSPGLRPSSPQRPIRLSRLFPNPVDTILWLQDLRQGPRGGYGERNESRRLRPQIMELRLFPPPARGLTAALPNFVQRAINRSPSACSGPSRKPHLDDGRPAKSSPPSWTPAETSTNPHPRDPQS